MYLCGFGGDNEGDFAWWQSRAPGARDSLPGQLFVASLKGRHPTEDILPKLSIDENLVGKEVFVDDKRSIE